MCAFSLSAALAAAEDGELRSLASEGKTKGTSDVVWEAAESRGGWADCALQRQSTCLFEKHDIYAPSAYWAALDTWSEHTMLKSGKLEEKSPRSSTVTGPA